ncbi:MAG: hypothetical protein GY853_11675 [PVC group bacterium]|nr:hypothetical protein [PVC group bacterium]
MEEREMRDEDELNLLDFFRVIWKYKILIVLIVIATCTISWVNNIRAPKIYESTATALPPESETKSMGSLSQFTQGVVGQMLPSLSYGSSTNMVLAMLKSRRMAEDIIKNYGLKKRWKAEFLIDAIGRIKGNTRISVSEEGVIAIAVESEDSQLAANIANFYVSNLNTMNEQLELSSSKPVVRSIDIAKPAEKKSKPVIRKNVMMAGLGALLLGIFLAFLKEYINRHKEKLNV